ncbi:hypothetical protein ACFQ6N_00455 [Kitasatospora sp. NPDC056446]|uniref:hypothetical protein n=1 Tax=Kitasatospora sp. NPDC056446 TaxID=3345819 RepID=UPI0036AC5DEC
MAIEPDILSLEIVCPPVGEGILEVRPVVSGRDLLTDLAGRGLSAGSRFLGSVPRYLLERNGRLHTTATPREVRLGLSGCCWERCCGALYVTVRRDGERVVWEGWRDPVKQGLDLPEIRFAADQYEAEVSRAEADRSWEWPAVTVAMLLEAALREPGDWLARWECELEDIWAARGAPEEIQVVLRHPPDREDTDLPYIQFGMTLPISADDPSEQARRLEAQLTAGDPRAVAEVWGGFQNEKLGYPLPDYPLST